MLDFCSFQQWGVPLDTLGELGHELYPRSVQVCRSGALGESAWLAEEVGETMAAAEVVMRE